MLAFFRHEWKLSFKTLMIWALSVGGMGLIWQKVLLPWEHLQMHLE